MSFIQWQLFWYVPQSSSLSLRELIHLWFLLSTLVGYIAVAYSRKILSLCENIFLGYIWSMAVWCLILVFAPTYLTQSKTARAMARASYFFFNIEHTYFCKTLSANSIWIHECCLFFHIPQIDKFRINVHIVSWSHQMFHRPILCHWSNELFSYQFSQWQLHVWLIPLSLYL